MNLLAGACVLSLIGVSFTKIAVNKAWERALAAGNEVVEAEEKRAFSITEK